MYRSPPLAACNQTASCQCSRAGAYPERLPSPMPYDYWRHFIRGWLFDFFGKPDQAFAAYELAARDNPQSAAATRALGYIAANSKRLADAARWYREAVRIAPDDASSWFNLGYVLGEDRRHSEAIAAFRRALDVQPTLDRAWYGMGMSHAALGQHAQAIEAFGEAARLQPMNGIAWYQLGMAHYHAGQSEALEKVIRRLADFEPKTSRQLMCDAGRSDLLPMIQDRIL